ncbi:hypothetical protein C2I06_09540 [Niallia circulans]|uniref:hypothetical protein n=1 Tax=Niallia circulans TaxID=1397 RepID=UPI000F44D776|nr:hypothetical protein [Niallia circulans]AYV67098.1 hypothetical protein C2I06_09540 [Niallia circulans]
MDKVMFGKLLGEVYRSQNREGYAPVKESTIFGLLNGFEHVIDEEIERIGFVSKEEFTIVGDILNEYFLDDEKLKNLEGYYDIEPELDRQGISRAQAIQILTYYKANGQFGNVIEKFNSQHSPTECKRFEIADYDK